MMPPAVVPTAAYAPLGAAVKKTTPLVVVTSEPKAAPRTSAVAWLLLRVSSEAKVHCPMTATEEVAVMTLCPAPRVRAPTASLPLVVELLVKERPLPPAVLLRRTVAVLLRRFLEEVWSWLFCRTLVGPFRITAAIVVNWVKSPDRVSCPWSTWSVPVKVLPEIAPFDW